MLFVDMAKDQRKLSFVYIDVEKISKVVDLHQKIRNIFCIDKPFHLYTDEKIFLPLNEDIRIIEKNDIITVVPEFFHCNGITKQQVSEEAQMNFIEPQKFENTQSPTNSRSQCELKTDIDYEPQVIVKEQDQVNSNQQEYEEFVDSLKPFKKKRKRSHRGKRNRQSSEVCESFNQPSDDHGNDGTDHENQSSSTPKHLKFDLKDFTNQHDKINGNSSQKSHNSKPIVRFVESADLSLLLGQKSSSSPIRFVSAKVKPSLSTPTNTKSNGCQQNGNHRIEQSDSPIKTNVDPNKKSINYAKINPLDYPPYNSKIQVDDVIAFRTLKMGEDYSPTVSGYIIAKVISKDGDQNNYTFQILEGHDQMKTPNGKFSLPNDEENNNGDVDLDESALVTLNVSHLVEPRLIYQGKLI